jgi:hypothetical protein
LGESRCPWVKVGDCHYVLARYVSQTRKEDLKYRSMFTVLEPSKIGLWTRPHARKLTT